MKRNKKISVIVSVFNQEKFGEEVVIGRSTTSTFEQPLKTITKIENNKKVIVDFTGTSNQLPNNFNAPKPVVLAAVLYCFRLLVDKNIPMNSGCLKPIKIIIPKNCMLNPKYPAAVVAGNVETSQHLVNALLSALNVMSSSQGTMNNLTFGNNKYQYYETICSGSPENQNK